MQVLNFPAYDFRFKNSENKVYIFDVVRKKFVVLQPEEWVRQHIVHYIISEKKYPLSLVNVEKQLKVNGLVKRYDVVIFNSDGTIKVLIECKAPEINITQTVFDQIARYNMQLKAEYLMVSNGLSHFYCEMDFQEEKYSFLVDIPEFSR
ncbi:type I restriction enzyme HsdR N-terminal domain-containing protein [Cellulophaga sp. E16_2]|uniref:Restriction endonuclease, type I, EcoRI, R subunit/Type III n=1 Tax=Cellulophaga algicola (strain DSM 14237 / IC166 / ACAM 630) TaxID=688270 RepID=E6XAR8_CELAD|nr:MULTISPECIES: type I restriction enzyme HsdR N-terminal domain-containing protein [Cellulophaga]ADV51030.1 Restriction endonuclease, type I, EcoRI, R subunit/Type III [Cellulophaga algicola DSM 14237]MBO0593423.1 type I restriction enzyme HsdR N-terminal domain-containing protein [Cellulophaga sp. E16_2]